MIAMGGIDKQPLLVDGLRGPIVVLATSEPAKAAAETGGASVVPTSRGERVLGYYRRRPADLGRHRLAGERRTERRLQIRPVEAASVAHSRDDDAAVAPGRWRDRRAARGPPSHGLRHGLPLRGRARGAGHREEVRHADESIARRPVEAAQRGAQRLRELLARPWAGDERQRHPLGPVDGAAGVEVHGLGELQQPLLRHAALGPQQRLDAGGELPHADAAVPIRI
mmetsp:Transcript_125528/g.363223  ORF Transcript_125528/g.363223 Transcript_125528/m.363223 type:complete len:225 (-) Transcript_125528:1492-2166(-)